MAITVSWTMRQFYDCVACDILMDKVTLNRIQVCCKFFFFFSVFSCRALLWNLCVLFAWRPYLPARAEAEKSNKGKRQRSHESYNHLVNVLALESCLKVTVLKKSDFTQTFLKLKSQVSYTVYRVLCLHNKAILYNLAVITNVFNNPVLKKLIEICDFAKKK